MRLPACDRRYDQSTQIVPSAFPSSMRWRQPKFWLASRWHVPVAALPAAQRTLIEAAFFEGYTHQELSERFGVPLGTVKTRIRNGLVSLRVRLEQTA